MQRSVYFPDDRETKGILERIEERRKPYNASFSEVVLTGLKLVLEQPISKDAKKEAKKGGFRAKKLAGMA